MKKAIMTALLLCVAFLAPQAQEQFDYKLVKEIIDNERTIPSLIAFIPEITTIGEFAKYTSETYDNCSVRFFKSKIGTNDTIYKVDSGLELQSRDILARYMQFIVDRTKITNILFKNEKSI